MVSMIARKYDLAEKDYRKQDGLLRGRKLEILALFANPPKQARDWTMNVRISVFSSACAMMR